MEMKEYKDGIQLSRLGMGNMRLPMKENGVDIDYEKSQEIIRKRNRNLIHFSILYPFFRNIAIYFSIDLR